MHTHAGDEDVQLSNKHTSDANCKQQAAGNKLLLLQQSWEQLPMHVKVQFEQNSASAAAAAILGAAANACQGAI